MPISDKKIYIQETEVKPNHYAVIILAFTVFVEVVCWVVNEIGIFRVGATEMRIGSSISIAASLSPIILFLTDKRRYSDPRMKYVVIGASAVFTFTVGLLLTFHTTIMLLFPVLFAMLYKSDKLGILAAVSSFACTVACPVLGYLLHTWDIPLFEELILIGTDGGLVTVVGGGGAHTMLNIGKILLYLVIPRIMMVGSCSILLMYIIKLGADHVKNQIELNRISQLDSLTGLYNQNACKNTIQTLKEQKKNEKIGVLFFDVNGLKMLNDAKGHECGDLLLKRAAKSLLDVCHDDNTAAFRVGGDEFIILMVGAAEDACSKKLAEWKESLDRINEENAEKYDGLNCSVAVGFAAGSSDKIDSIVKLADSYMYRSKARMKGGVFPGQGS